MKQRGVCSESGGENQACLRGFFFFLTQLSIQVARCAAAEGGGGGLFGAVCRESVKQVSGKRATDVFSWICGRLRNESSSEAPAALPAVLLLWSRAARCHLARSGHPGTR